MSDLLRKVKIRQYSIDNSWKGKESMNPSISQPEDHSPWKILDESLRDASGAKQIVAKGPIIAGTTGHWKIKFFFKRAIRKVLFFFLGWYINPILQKQNYFNGKILNSVSEERTILAQLQQLAGEQQEALNESQRTIQIQQEGVEWLKQCFTTQKEALVNIEEMIRTQQKTIEQFRQRSKTYEEALTSAQRTIRNQQESLERLNQRGKAQQEALLNVQETIQTHQEHLRKIENLPTEDDQFYHDFEEAFRGSREDIRNRMEKYVPIIKERLPDWSEASFVDVGSGRGEWLDILKYNGAKNYIGVDLNQQQNAIAESFGHKTICKDCIRYLSEQPDGSLDLITGFQIIEHLCMSDLMELLQQSFRALKSGGMILFETPNPHNLSVAADTFYSDVSHKRPLNPEMLKFWVNWCGFSSVDLLFENTHPHCKEITITQTDDADNQQLVKTVNEICWLLYGPQDYTIFARK